MSNKPQETEQRHKHHQDFTVLYISLALSSTLFFRQNSVLKKLEVCSFQYSPSFLNSNFSFKVRMSNFLKSLSKNIKSKDYSLMIMTQVEPFLGTVFTHDSVTIRHNNKEMTTSITPLWEKRWPWDDDLFVCTEDWCPETGSGEHLSRYCCND